MKLPPIRILNLSGSPEEMGHQHGTAYGEQIREYTSERIELVTAGRWSGGPISRSDVLDIAESMLGAHETFSAPLHAEMLAMASTAGISPAEAIIVGGFTDFVDTVRAEVGGAVPDEIQEDDCTAVIVPDHRANGQGFFAQTWDMHDTATKHVILMRIKPEDGPAALVFSTGGALGQIGMNELGVCVGINNLTATDGRRGVTWPSVVREALKQQSTTEAKEVILSADLAGGHNFHLLDADGVGCSIEAMPTVRPVDTLNDAAIVRTNHVVSEEARTVEGPKAPEMMASSKLRLQTGLDLVDRADITSQDLMDLTRESGSICQVPTEPFHVESSGAAIMRPKTKEFWACWGQPAMNDYELISFP